MYWPLKTGGSTLMVATWDSELEFLMVHSTVVVMGDWKVQHSLHLMAGKKAMVGQMEPPIGRQRARLAETRAKQKVVEMEVDSVESRECAMGHPRVPEMELSTVHCLVSGSALSTVRTSLMESSLVLDSVCLMDFLKRLVLGSV
jgi:hypothetical protein